MKTQALMIKCMTWLSPGEISSDTASRTWEKLKTALLSLSFPIIILVLWHIGTAGRPYSLIPPPSAV